MGLNINSGRLHALVKVIQNDLELDAEIASYLQTANEVPAEDKFDQMRDKVEATYNPISRQPIAMERLGEELNREPAALGGSTTVFQAQAEVRTQTQPAQSGGMFSRLGFGGS